MRQIAAILLVVAIAACTPAVRSPNAVLIDRLKNRGPVALSPDNPFLGANLLLSREMAASPELKGFVEHRGSPSAISIETSMFDPMIMEFYYLDDREQFVFEREGDLWVIRGPLAIPKDVFQDVLLATRGIARGQQASPDLESVPAPVVDARTELPSEDPFIKKLEELEPTPRSITGFQSPTHSTTAADSNPFPIAPAPELPPAAPPQPRHITAPPPPAIPRQQPQIAAAQPPKGGKAEINSRGDIVHKIGYSGESLSIIARWYTNDRGNAARLARINNLKDPNTLAIGDTIIIPKYLIKNRQELTGNAFRMLKQEADQLSAGSAP